MRGSAPGQLVVVATDPHGGWRRAAWTEPDGTGIDVLEWNLLPALPRTRRAEELLGGRHEGLAVVAT